LSSTQGSTETQQQLDQQICAVFTQDHHVFAVLTSENSVGPDARQCLANAHVALIKNYLADSDSQTLGRFPLYFLPSTIALDRLAAIQPAILAKGGYFDTKPVIGIITQDNPDFAFAVDHILVPRLRSIGYPVKDVARFPIPNSQSDAQNVATAASDTVVRFRTDGVDHVILLSSDGVDALLFGNAAESQRYYPRYAFTSQDAAEALVEGGFMQDPTATLARALSVDFAPAIDTPPSYLNDFQARAPVKHCLALLAAGGQRPDSAQNLWHAELNCDAFFFLDDALTGRVLSAGSLLDGVASLGSSIDPVATFSTRFDSLHHDGGDTVRLAAFAGACTCFRYTQTIMKLTD
jgi:hypothetical protein